MHSGSCFCGAIRYEIHGKIGVAYYCHCSRCRKISGSAFSANAMVDPGEFFVVEGKDLLKATISDSGVSRAFCSNCGSSILVSQGDQMRLRLGTLDTPLPEPPIMHIFTGSKANWLAICDDLPQHVERPAG